MLVVVESAAQSRSAETRAAAQAPQNLAEEPAVTAETAASTSVLSSLPFWAPVILLITLSALIRLSNADLAFSRLFVNQTGDIRFIYWNQQPWRVLYEYGPYPGVLLSFGVGGLLVLWGLITQQWRVHTRVGLFLLLAGAIGPGLLVNGALKTYWGRPRPRDITDFGGAYAFVPVGEMGPAPANSAFPCGHAAMAFIVITPAFLGRRCASWRCCWLALGLSLGVIIGLSRIIQGGHFLSDILWAAGITYLSTWLVARLLSVDCVEPQELWTRGARDSA